MQPDQFPAIMNNLIEVPLWLLVVLTALAVVTSLQYFLLPPVRMLLRRRANRYG